MSLSLREIETLQKIRTLYLEGKNYKTIQAELDIPAGSWDSIYYRNEYGFRDFINSIKRERFLKEAEKVSDQIMEADHSEDVRILAIKQKEAEFLRETLGKDQYSKKTEIDNSAPITINVKSYNENIKSVDIPVNDLRVSLPADEKTTPRISEPVKPLTK